LQLASFAIAESLPAGATFPQGILSDSQELIMDGCKTRSAISLSLKSFSFRAVFLLGNAWFVDTVFYQWKF